MLLPIIKKIWTTDKTSKDEYLIACPFHEDNKPSLSINVSKGLFKCHACDEHGTAVKLLAKELNYSEAIIRYELDYLKEHSPIAYDPNDNHKSLLSYNKLMEHVTKVRHWSLEVIEREQIGWDGKRITIPIKNIFGDTVNIRKYKPKSGPTDYKVINTKGCGKARLYGLQGLKPKLDRVFICEGEPDWLCLTSQGYTVLTSTAGAKHFDVTWAAFFIGQNISIIFDNDDAGKAGGSKIARCIGSGAKSIRLLTERLKEKEDLTDYVHRSKEREPIEVLYKASEPIDLSTIQKDEFTDDDEIYEVTLAESSDEQYFNKQVVMNVMISGKTLSPYLVPKKVKITCPLPGLKMCAACGVQHAQGDKTLSYEDHTIDLLQLIEVGTDIQHRLFKEKAQIPSRCKLPEIKVIEVQNVEEAKVIPNLDYNTDDSDYVMRQIFILGHDIQSNFSYKILGVSLPHPKTQQVTYLIKEIKPLQDGLDNFSLSDDLTKSLRVFSVDGQDSTKA